MKNWIIQQLIRMMTPLLRFVVRSEVLFKYMEERGYHVTPVHFYQPIPDTRELEIIFPECTEMTGIAWQKDKQLQLLNEAFLPFQEETNQFAQYEHETSSFYLDNGNFVGIDPHVYYAMVRHFQPKTIIEVGAGYSTLIAAQAAEKNGDTKIIAIDPYLRDFIEAGLPGVEFVRSKVEALDVHFFDRLEDGDFLFIDSSHVVRAGGDVCYLILDVLPRLASGVIVHIHDIFLPYNYPRDWFVNKQIFWNEQYLVQAYLTHNNRVQILMANHFLTQDHSNDVQRAFPNALTWTGGSLWFRV